MPPSRYLMPRFVIWVCAVINCQHCRRSNAINDTARPSARLDATHRSAIQGLSFARYGDGGFPAQGTKFGCGHSRRVPMIEMN